MAIRIEPETALNGGSIVGGSATIKITAKITASGGAVIGGNTSSVLRQTIISDKYKQSTYGLPNKALQKISFVYKPRSREGYVDALSKIL